MASAQEYFAVIGDLVGSRQLSDRGAIQGALESTLRELNERFSEQLASRFVVTLGDEFQGLLRLDASLEAIWWSYMRSMRLMASTRFGFGRGALSTEVYEEALGMDGPCFYAAREAIGQAREAGRLFAFAVHGRSDLSAAFNRSAGLLNRMMADWTDVQWETVALFEQYRNQSVVAEMRQVSRQTVNESLVSSFGVECLEAFRGLLDLVRLG